MDYIIFPKTKLSPAVILVFGLYIKEVRETFEEKKDQLNCS